MSKIEIGSSVGMLILSCYLVGMPDRVVLAPGQRIFDGGQGRAEATKLLVIREMDGKANHRHR